MPSKGSVLSPESRSEGACRQHVRYALLLGTSLLVFAAFPSAALAQNECGAPPPGGGTIVCPPGAYPTGISYTAQPADLTIVLPAGVNAGDTVELRASAAGVDLRLDGAAGATVVTSGANTNGIHLYSTDGSVQITSDTVRTSGTNSRAITGGTYTGGTSTGPVTVVSTSVTTSGYRGYGIVVIGGGDVAVTSGTLITTGHRAEGIHAASRNGSATVISGTLSTRGNNASGIDAEVGPGDVTVISGTLSTAGDFSNGIFANAGGTVTVSSTNLTSSGHFIRGISATGTGDVTVTSGTLATHINNPTNNNAYGIAASSRSGNTVVTSGTLSTDGNVSTGIRAYAENGHVNVTSGSVTTQGNNSIGINVNAGLGATVTSGTVVTAGSSSEGIHARSDSGTVTIVSGSATTTGQNSDGVVGLAADGDVVITSGSVATSQVASDAIYARADNGNATITSTTVTTAGIAAFGITGFASGRVVIISGNVVTTGPISVTGTGSIAIFARRFGDPNGSVSITSGNIATSGGAATGIDALALGDVDITSTGNLVTSGAEARAIVAVSNAGAVTVDVNNVGTAGANSDAITVAAATASTVTVRGLLQATNGFEINADGGAATVNTTASGIIRGAIDLTGNADRVNNGGTFDAIGASQLGAGTDIFTNTGLTTSFNGAAVLAGLETFNTSGRVDMRDGAVGDTLNVTGTFTGSGASRLGVDANLAANQADVLITGAATGSTVLDVNLLGNAVFNLTGTLVVDGGAGTSATAFTLAGGVQNNPYVALSLLFDAPSNNFLLVGLPGQPVFETIAQAEMIGNFWSQSADAVSAQLEAARDGGAPPAGGNLAGGGHFGGWVQLLAGKVERDASQSSTGGGATTQFNTSYDQDFQGVQAGLDYQSGGTIIGITFGAGRADAEFEQSFNRVDLDGYNAGAYAAFNSGGFFFNAIAKVDWIEAEATPGAGLSAEFDATAWGLRGAAGFRFGMGNVYLEPSASLSWVNVEIDDYVSNGATVAFDDYTSLHGAAGVRFGGDFRSGRGVWSPFVGVHAIEELKGDARSDFTLGQTIALRQDAPGTFGELAAGLNHSTGRLEAFIRGELDFGGEREGLSGRAGARIRF